MTDTAKQDAQESKVRIADPKQLASLDAQYVSAVQAVVGGYKAAAKVLVGIRAQFLRWAKLPAGMRVPSGLESRKVEVGGKNPHVDTYVLIPDWNATTSQYQKHAAELLDKAMPDALQTQRDRTASAIRYHVSSIVREVAPAAHLKVLGLDAASLKAKAADKAKAEAVKAKQAKADAAKRATDPTVPQPSESNDVRELAEHALKFLIRAADIATAKGYKRTAIQPTLATLANVMTTAQKVAAVYQPKAELKAVKAS